MVERQVLFTSPQSIYSTVIGKFKKRHRGQTREPPKFTLRVLDNNFRQQTNEYLQTI
jgi:hypothetical protein